MRRASGQCGKIKNLGVVDPGGRLQASSRRKLGEFSLGRQQEPHYKSLVCLAGPQEGYILALSYDVRPRNPLAQVGGLSGESQKLLREFSRKPNIDPPASGELGAIERHTF